MLTWTTKKHTAYGEQQVITSSEISASRQYQQAGTRVRLDRLECHETGRDLAAYEFDVGKPGIGGYVPVTCSACGLDELFNINSPD